MKVAWFSVGHCMVSRSVGMVFVNSVVVFFFSVLSRVAWMNEGSCTLAVSTIAGFSGDLNRNFYRGFGWTLPKKDQIGKLSVELDSTCGDVNGVDEDALLVGSFE